jgi:LysM repeat protein
MKKLNLSLAILFVLAGKLIFAQSSETIKQYIETYKAIAIAEMQRTGVPAAITLAQGIHETGAGTSDLVIKSNNHFGIKCKSDWKGESVSHDDDARGECFRKYADPFESYRDHSDFLKYRPYYADLFKLDPTDYEGWAYGLKKAGYATNPRYPQILIKLIRDYDLQQYTLIALNGTPSGDVAWTSKNDSSESIEGPVGTESGVAVLETDLLRNKYPSGIFQINDTKVTVVFKGTSYLKIAEENRISLSRLFEFNDMKPSDIAATDQLIYLQRKRKTGANEFHTVAEGETLHSIAQSEGIRIENLLEFNSLKLHMKPAAGEILFLRSAAPAMPKLGMERTVMIQAASIEQYPAKQNVSEEYILHTVEPRETLYAIAKKYTVAIEDLMKWNDLPDAELRPGQQLRIKK